MHPSNTTLILRHEFDLTLKKYLWKVSNLFFYNVYSTWKFLKILSQSTIVMITVKFWIVGEMTVIGRTTTYFAGRVHKNFKRTT